MAEPGDLKEKIARRIAVWINAHNIENVFNKADYVLAEEIMNETLLWGDPSGLERQPSINQLLSINNLEKMKSLLTAFGIAFQVRQGAKYATDIIAAEDQTLWLDVAIFVFDKDGKFVEYFKHKSD